MYLRSPGGELLLRRISRKVARGPGDSVWLVEGNQLLIGEWISAGISFTIRRGEHPWAVSRRIKIFEVVEVLPGGFCLLYTLLPVRGVLSAEFVCLLSIRGSCRLSIRGSCLLNLSACCLWSCPACGRRWMRCLLSYVLSGGGER